MPGTSDRSERWAGGFVRIVGDGPTRQRVYVIRKMVGGRRYEVSTHRGTEVDALLELAKFQKSPATYDPTPEPDLLGDEGPEPVYLDADLIEEHLDYCTKVGISHVWWISKRRFLGWWLEKLHGFDLRKADLRLHILKPLEGATSRQHRIAVIKHLYAWLRDAENGKGLLHASEDPTLSALKVPQRAPAQETRRRAFSVEDLDRVKKALASPAGSSPAASPGSAASSAATSPWWVSPVSAVEFARRATRAGCTTPPRTWSIGCSLSMSPSGSGSRRFSTGRFPGRGCAASTRCSGCASATATAA